ncbi:MAG: NAD-dependent epimerase/dehydratase family protein [Halobacteriaceae archaeon]
MRVAVTGAAGNVGREAVAALDDHDVTALTHHEHDDMESDLLEVTDYEAVRAALDGQDAVVHLAANPSPGASWESAHEVNIGGTYNVFEAAREAGCDRVVFASTNHVTQMYGIDDPSRPETMAADAPTVRPDAPPRPDSFYGVSKVTGEALGTYYHDRYGMEVVNLRIGWLLDPADLREKHREEEASVARYARAMWLSPRDCRAAVRRSVEADLADGLATVNAVSRNAERYLSVTETMRRLDYRPRDDSSEQTEG